MQENTPGPMGVLLIAAVSKGWPRCVIGMGTVDYTIWAGSPFGTGNSVKTSLYAKRLTVKRETAKPGLEL
jgi:hypothetical protein